MAYHPSTPARDVTGGVIDPQAGEIGIGALADQAPPRAAARAELRQQQRGGVFGTAQKRPPGIVSAGAGLSRYCEDV